MNKACFLPLVLATAVASATFADQYTNVFTGVTAVSSAGVPSATGGSWTTEGVVLTNVDNKVEFDAEGEAVLRLSITSAPQDTNTIFRVAVNGTIEDVGELITPPDTAQTAFAICTNSFHAWNGSAWVVLDEVPAGFDGSTPTNLVVEISYQGTNAVRKARFTVGDTLLKLRSNGTEPWVTLGAPATSANNLTAFGVNGSGTLAAVNGDVMLGVAEYDGVKYGTLTEAVANADSGKEVVVLRPTKEDISLDKDVAIADGGNVQGTITVAGDKAVDVLPTKEEFTGQTLAGKSGEYTIPVKVNGGTVNVVLPPEMSNKEIVGSVGHAGTTVTVTIQTAANVITNAAPDGSKALAASETKLRTFLNSYAKEAYDAADASSANIAAAIATNGVNNIPLYQSYALGINPGDSVKPVAVANDSATDGITLTIPAVDTAKYSGDYTITYKVGSGTAQGNPGAIKVPLATGSYPVKIVFE